MVLWPRMNLFEFHDQSWCPAVLRQAITDCVTTQLYRFATGRAELDDADERVVDTIHEQLDGPDFTFEDLVLEVVAHPSFAMRREE